MLAYFNAFDVDGSGTVDMREVRTACCPKPSAALPPAAGAPGTAQQQLASRARGLAAQTMLGLLAMDSKVARKHRKVEGTNATQAEGHE